MWLTRILIEEKTGEQLEQEGHGENIVETIESIIFANDSTAFNQALLDAIRIDDENTTLQVYIPIAGQSPSLSGFRPIASFAPVPLLEQQTITLTTPKAKKALSKPSSSPVFAASSLAPLQKSSCGRLRCWVGSLPDSVSDKHAFGLLLPSTVLLVEMGKIQKDCTHALENQTVSFNPDDVERVGNRNRQSLMHRPISITKNTTDNAEFFRAEVPYKTGSEPEDVSISPSLTHPIAPLPQFTHLLDIATSRIFIGITWDILHVTSHLQNQLKYRGEISVGERVDGSTGGVWSLNHSDRFLFTVAERGSHTIEPGKELKLPSLSESDVHPLSLPCQPNISLIESLFTPQRWNCLPLTTNHSHNTNTSIVTILPIRRRSRKEMSKTRNRHKLRELVQVIKAKGQRKQLERRIHKCWHKTRSLEDEEFEREPKELLKQEKSEKKRQNLDDLVSSEEGLSGADDGDKVLAGLQDTAFRTIAQLLQPSEDDGLKEYLGAMESIADAIFASNLEVEGEEEMTDVAFSFVSEDELSDSDKSDMERLLTMLSPVDSSDSVMLLHQNNRSLECKRNK
ncbi:hypothetical protein BLNAU_19587 [Blattamonas nauphoetae]|uniref:Uncharacterized protein n=1 Tax=Blattamonas nauphoetae TaxID=2049346 RepID=A0ABQ9X179_9EUKA|nr:hypothetical protein BLNAU_19587 [Blattamonas nauphoetae]